MKDRFCALLSQQIAELQNQLTLAQRQIDENPERSKSHESVSGGGNPIEEVQVHTHTHTHTRSTRTHIHVQTHTQHDIIRISKKETFKITNLYSKCSESKHHYHPSIHPFIHQGYPHIEVTPLSFPHSLRV